MKAEIIAVGTELLMGQIANTNAQFLSQELAGLGIGVYYHTVVGDNVERLTEVLTIAQKRADWVILSGGLGPTEDDLTKQTLAAFLERELRPDPAAMAKLDAFFASNPKRIRTANNDRQADMIEGARALPNRTGLAVGSLIEDQGVTYVVLPGPPSELKPMFLEQVAPLLKQEQALYSRVLRFFGIGESQLVTHLVDLIANQTNPTLAPYAKVGEVTLRLTAQAATPEAGGELLDRLEQAILQEGNLKDYLYAYGDDQSLARTVLDLLKENRLTLTAAESLTAGLLQAELAQLPGASAVFPGGFVTYSLEQKSQMLGIPQEELQVAGVVSAWTAERMAEGARARTGADLAISLTGVAGPDQLEGQEVGTVWLGLAGPTGTNSHRLYLGGRDRNTIRQLAVLEAFNLIRETLIK
ncbi:MULTISPECIES: competence/damage-inducible protein A [unclassified Streptococcus]|uniref:competence/damage-inducible protein A n=1 Tax=unclassified Streptococcus TaxID=2608887 RepID=UPI0010726EBD|nr:MULTISPECIES: competence/damage-inducible protein A [unclassified Streptococcus]MBF0805481.1 competence/damage-inducible protein A [Streptococcus sp. 19428wA2_WM07]TFU29017.1 competence/damage-inducible protein A [Streptococcus sp. WM07]